MSAQKGKNINKQTIDNFNPDTMSFEQSCQDFLLKILEFDEQTCELPIVEIKMFAISKKYQDIFYEYAGFVFCRFGICSNVSYIKTCIYKL